MGPLAEQLGRMLPRGRHPGVFGRVYIMEETVKLLVIVMGTVREKQVSNSAVVDPGLERRLGA